MMVNLAGTWNNLGVGVWGVAGTNKYSKKGFSRRSQEGRWKPIRRADGKIGAPTGMKSRQLGSG